MSSKGSTYGQFRRAIDAGQVMAAYALASELRHVRLDDALDLCFLLASAKDWRYERAAKRWLQRFIDEAHPSLHETLLAGAALADLKEPRDCRIAQSALRDLINPRP